MASTLEKKLKAANAAFKKARAAVEAGGGAKGGDFFNEVGRFDTRITDSDVNESQNGRPQGYLEFTITDGEFKGQTFRTYWGLEPDAEKLSYFIKDMARLGKDVPEDLEEVGDFLQKIVKEKICVTIRRVEKGDYINNRIVKVLDNEGNDVAPAEGEAAAAAEETPPEDAAVDFVPEVGQRVQHAEKGAGVVKATDEDDKDATVKFDGGEKCNVPWAELAAEEAAAPAEPEAPAAEAAAEGGDDDEIKAGKRLMVEDTKQKIKGVGAVVSVNEKTSEVTLKMEEGGKKVTVGVDKLSLPPAPAKKAGMRVGKK